MDVPRGTLVAYATEPGEASADGEGANSPYTLALAEAMKIPDLVAERVFMQVRVAVMKETNGAQVPWEMSSFTGNFYFNPVTVSAESAPVASQVGTGLTADKEMNFWQSIQDSTNE